MRGGKSPLSVICLHRLSISVEVKEGMALNFVAQEPGKVVMPAGNPRTREILEKAGAEVLEQDISELRKGWGGIHCMTPFLRRD